MVMLLYSWRALYAARSASWFARSRAMVVDGVAWRKPEWPFDLYPTFAGAAPSQVELWEARWVTSDGREVRVSPGAYWATFGNPGMTWEMAVRTRPDSNAAASRAHSLNLVRALWRSETLDVRTRVSDVRVYVARYRLQPTVHSIGILGSETLIETFPVGAVR
jgi:hypothetical protein